MGRVTAPKPNKDGTPRKVRKDKGLSRTGGPSNRALLESRVGIKDGLDQNHTRRVKAPPSRYPEDHPLWSYFRTWVETSGVVRADLLTTHPGSLSGSDWSQAWKTWLSVVEILLDNPDLQSSLMDLRGSLTKYTNQPLDWSKLTRILGRATITTVAEAK